MAKSEWDKNLNTKAFAKLELKNTKCTIFIVINAYRIGIDSLDIRLIFK